MVQRFVTRALYFGALGLIWFSAVSCPGRVRAAAAVAPIRLLALYDQTTSRDQSRIAPLTAADVQRLADMVIARGGELTFGVIDESSDQPLTRLYAGLRPQAPPPPARTGNPFEDRRRVRAPKLRKARPTAAR